MIIIVVLLVSLRSRLPVRLPGRPGGPFWAGPKTGLVGPTLAGAQNGSEMNTFNDTSVDPKQDVMDFNDDNKLVAKTRKRW